MQLSFQDSCECDAKCLHLIIFNVALRLLRQAWGQCGLLQFLNRLAELEEILLIVS